MITGKTFVFIGTSGSGKNVQIQMLTEYLRGIKSGIKHFETGVELKKISNDEKDGSSKVLQTILKNGGPAPNSLIKNLFDNFLLEVDDDEALIIDGLPRTLYQSVYIDDILSRIDRSRNTIIIHLNVSEDVALERLVKRAREEAGCSADLNLIRKRFRWFKQDSLPCITFFAKSKEYTILEINGEGSKDEVFDRLKSKLDKILKVN